jgi:hypothetical protein
VTNEIVATFQSIKEAQDTQNINGNCISRCCRGHKKHKTAGGFKWEFVIKQINNAYPF